MTVGPNTFPAANAVNDGARRGLRLLMRAGHPRDSSKDEIVVRVAKFATNLWRTINGHRLSTKKNDVLEPEAFGVCSYDGILRCSLLSLWQWIWPKACFPVMRVHLWKTHEGTERYKALGAHLVMQQTTEEKEAADAEENLSSPIVKIVNFETDRQLWRGDMAKKAYDYHREEKKSHPVVKELNDGLGDVLPPVKRDNAFKQGGWIASTAQQRRAASLDGGTAVTKIRLTVKGSGD